MALQVPEVAAGEQTQDSPLSPSAAPQPAIPAGTTAPQDLLQQPTLDVLTPDQAQFEAARRPTTLGEYLGSSFRQGLDESVTGRIFEELTTPNAAPVPVDDPGLARNPRAAAIAGMTARQPIDPGDRAMSEEEWKTSPFYRKEIPWDRSMTPARAEAFSQSFDERRYRDMLYENYQGGLAGQAMGIVAQIAGGAMDPVNYVPILGPATRALAVERLGVIAGHVLTGAAEGAIGTAITEPFLARSLTQRGEDYGLPEIMADIAIGGAAGGVFGGIAGGLERRARMRATAETLRIDGLQRNLDAAEAARLAVANDDPVDVGAMIRSDAALRDRLMSSTAPLTDPEGVRIAGLPDRPVDAEVGFARRADGTIELGRLTGPSLRAMGFDEAPIILEPGMHEEGGRSFGLAHIEARHGDEIRSYVGPDGERYQNAESLVEDVVRGFNEVRDDGHGGLFLVKRNTDDIAARANFPTAIVRLLPTDDGSAWKVGTAGTFSNKSLRRHDILWSGARSPAARPATVTSPSMQLRPGQGGDEAPWHAIGGQRNTGNIDPISAFAKDFVTREQAEARHASIIEAERRLPQLRRPQTETTGLAEDMRLGKGESDIPEMEDIAVLRRDRGLTAGDEALLKDADEIAQTAEKYGITYESMVGCIMRFGD